MSILDDISMGLGFKEKDQDYYDRTAATIERNQGSGAADRYRSQTADARAAAPGGSSNNANVSNFAQSVLDSDDVSAFLPGGDKTGDDLKKFQTVYNFQSDQSDSDPRGQSTQSGVLTSRNYAVNIDPVTADLSAPQNPAGLQSLVGGSMLGRGLSALGGYNQSEDKVVNIVDGKPIYQKSDGTYYSINALGLPYDVASMDTLDEDPEQVARREAMMSNMGSDDDGPSVIDELLDNDSGTTDPCPEGYVYDSEQMMCVIDPSTGLTPDLPTMELPDPSVPLSDYTQVANNFIPTPLQPIAPNPIQQQLSRLNRSMSGPRQQQRASGLAGANTGIMQVRP
jgi:hypothetical protein